MQTAAAVIAGVALAAGLIFLPDLIKLMRRRP
jgi:hypothetical protein